MSPCDDGGCGFLAVLQSHPSINTYDLHRRMRVCVYVHACRRDFYCPRVLLEHEPARSCNWGCNWGRMWGIDRTLEQCGPGCCSTSRTYNTYFSTYNLTTVFDSIHSYTLAYVIIPPAWPRNSRCSLLGEDGKPLLLGCPRVSIYMVPLDGSQPLAPACCQEEVSPTS